jgi:hypothetical protein
MGTINARSALVGALLFAAAPLAFAASDGNYKPARQHCSGNANNSDTPNYTEHGCHNWTLTVSDYGGHEYFGWGLQQVAGDDQGPVPPVIPFGTGSGTHEMAFWYDPGPDQGGCVYTTFDANTQMENQEPCPWFVPGAPNYIDPVAPNPGSGLSLYMGADDNLAGGEHDSSHLADNGPSDGGAVELNLNPASLMKWIAYLQVANIGKLLVHPVPILDGGVGACADGICFSAQTTRRDQTYPDGTSTYQPVADYSGHEWDPADCNGEAGHDDAAHCGTPDHPTYTLADWNTHNGDPAIEPGIQIYEDPDAQGSPFGGAPYPIPAIYVGTCGVIIGGGDLAQTPMPPSQEGAPYINSAGQLVIPTGCDQTPDDYYSAN